MSGQWEVVGKKKERSKKISPSESNSKNQKKPVNVLNGVKLEEVLPKSQVHNLLNSPVKNKNKEDKPSGKVKHQEPKKENKPAKVQEAPKPKPPKSIESAFSLISDEEFRTIYEKSKTLYPTAPIVWLKDLTTFLNNKISVEIHDPLFSSKHVDYPFSVVPSKIKSVIEESIREAGTSNAQLYFDIALTSMVTDLSKGLPANGYRFYLQHIARSEPTLVTDNISKYVTLKNSYQNRPNVALAMMWAVGQVGVVDQQCGFKVFEELMLPLVELKHFSPYVLKYLLDLINRTSSTALSKEEYLVIMDSVFSNKKIPSDLQKQLYKSHSNVKNLVLKNSKDKYASFVEPFLEKISSKNDKMYQDCLCDVLVSVIGQDPNVLLNWKKHYVKNIMSSAVLLKYIENNYEKLKDNVRSTGFREFLVALEEINTELATKKRKEPGMVEVISYIKNIQDKHSNKKSNSRGLFSRFLRFITITAFLAITVETIFKVRQGHYETSCLGKINSQIVSYASLANDRFKKEYPECHEKILNASEPYVELARGMGKLMANYAGNIHESSMAYVNEKYPQVISYIDTQYPGMTTKIYENYRTIQGNVGQYINGTVEYLKDRLPVEKFSADNMKDILNQVTEVTIKKFNEFYDWGYHTVQRIAK